MRILKTTLIGKETNIIGKEFEYYEVKIGFNNGHKYTRTTRIEKDGQVKLDTIIDDALRKLAKFEKIMDANE